MKQSITNNIEKITFILLLVFFICGGLLRAIYVNYSDFDLGAFEDHFVNAVSAKNIARGLGWSASGVNTIPLNPENLTTGPTVIFPAALANKAFGSSLQMPGVFVFVFNVFLLLLFLRVSYGLFEDKQVYYLFSGLLITFFMLFKSYYWYRLLGEIPGILLLLVAAAYLCLYMNTQRKLYFLLSALCASLALGTKQVALLAVVVFPFGVFFLQCFVCRRGVVRALGSVCVFCAIAGVVPFVFYLYAMSLIEMQSPQWQSEYYTLLKLMYGYSSGMDNLCMLLGSPDMAIETIRKLYGENMSMAKAMLEGSIVSGSGIGLGIVLWLCVYSLVLIVSIWQLGRPRLATLVAFSALPVLLWFFLLSGQSLPRHLFIGFALLVVSVILCLVCIPQRWLRGLMAVALIALMAVTGGERSRQLLTVWPLEPSPMYLATLDMENFLQQRFSRADQPSVAWVGLRTNNEFEFIGDRSNRFVNVENILAQTLVLDEEAYLQQYPDLSRQIEQGEYASVFDHYRRIDRHHIFPEPVKMRMSKPFQFDRLAKKSKVSRLGEYDIHYQRGYMCQEIVYQNAVYIIERCSERDFTQYFDGGSDFVPLRPRVWVFPTIYQ